MIYNQIKPHPDLAAYIDAFWIVESSYLSLYRNIYNFFITIGQKICLAYILILISRFRLIIKKEESSIPKS